MKIEWQNIWEITIGVAFGMALVSLIMLFFGDWLKEQAEKIMKK